MRQLAEIVIRDGIVVARLSGDVDIENAEALKDTLVAAVPNSAGGLVLDLTRSRYVDSAGIRVLFALATRLRMRQQDMRLAVPEASPLLRVLGIVGLDASVVIHRSAEDAVAAFTGEAAGRSGGSKEPHVG